MFSIREERVLRIIGRKKLTYSEISAELFKDTKTLDQNIKVANTINKINKKCDFHSTSWQLIKSRKDNSVAFRKGKRW